MKSESNMLLTPDCHGVEAKRRELEQLLAAARNSAIDECVAVVKSRILTGDDLTYQEEVRMMAFNEVAKSLLKLKS